MDQDRTQILQKVAKGKLTPEEADSLLDTLDTNTRSGGKPAPSQERIEQTFQVGPDGWLNINTDRGSIEVDTANTETLTVEIVPQNSEYIPGAFHISLDQSDNDVNITGKLHKEELGLKDSPNLKLKFLLTVPKKYNVNLNTAGGSVSVADLEGEVRSKTAGGNLHFGHIRGPVMGKTSGGSIHLDGCKGPTDVKTSGGSIKIGPVESKVVAHTSGGSIHIDRAAGSVDARTSGGSINVNEVLGDINARTSGGSVNATITRQPKHACDLKTSGGNVNVSLAETIALNLDAKTSGGRVTTDFSINGSQKKNILQAPINGGGPQLTLRTSGGGICINKT